MGNLLSEYRRRHNSDFIWAANDGICFFNKNRKPAAVCLLTDACRAVSNCDICAIRQPRFVCEVLAPANGRVPRAFPPPSGKQASSIFKLLAHDHVNVDIDVAKVLASIDPELTPYIAKDQKNIETWLWNFFLQIRPFAKYTIFDFFVKGQDPKQSNVMRAMDQMVWAATNLPSIYTMYYDRVYSPLLIGRNYLLYK